MQSDWRNEARQARDAQFANRRSYRRLVRALCVKPNRMGRRVWYLSDRERWKWGKVAGKVRQQRTVHLSYEVSNRRGLDRCLLHETRGRSGRGRRYFVPRSTEWWPRGGGG